MPGFTVGKVENKLGIKASGTCMLHLDNVRVSTIQIIITDMDYQIHSLLQFLLPAK